MPVLSLCVAIDRPLALVVVTVSLMSEPFAAISVCVTVELPLVFSTVVEVVVKSNTPAPLGSTRVVVTRPLALVVVTLCPVSEPLGA